MNQLIILCGIPFAGKTVFAKTLENKFNFKRVDLDEIKFKLFGPNITDEDIDQKGWDAIYQNMYQEIEMLLQKGDNVVHDTGNFTQNERGLVQDIAKSLNISFKTVFIDTPTDVALKRLQANRENQKRFDISDQAFWEAVAEMEKPGEEENSMTYSGKKQTEEWIKSHLQ